VTVIDYQGSIFGQIVTGWDVEQWVLDLLERWTSTYMSEVERQHGMVAGTLARPRSFVRTISFDKLPEDQLPAVMVISTGLAGPPKTSGETIRASWAVGIGVVCSARTQDEAKRNASFLTAALRDLFKQRPSLDGHALGTDWAIEAYDDLTFDDTRSLAGGRLVFAIEVGDVVSVNAGPATPDVPLDPDTLPWPDWQQVEEVDLDVEADPFTGSPTAASSYPKEEG
jgi:hypothetical protein